MPVSKRPIPWLSLLALAILPPTFVCAEDGDQQVDGAPLYSLDAEPAISAQPPIGDYAPAIIAPYCGWPSATAGRAHRGHPRQGWQSPPDMGLPCTADTDVDPLTGLGWPRTEGIGR